MTMFPYIVTGGKDAMKRPDVASSGLNSRIAFVLILENDDQCDLNRAHEKIVQVLIETIAAALNATINYLEDMGTPARVSHSLEAFQHHRPPAEEDGFEPLHIPNMVSMKCNCIVTGMIVCEPWCNIGGLWPYHDSYTYAMYVKDEPVRQKVLCAVIEMCKYMSMPDPQLVSLDDCPA